MILGLAESAKKWVVLGIIFFCMVNWVKSCVAQKQAERVEQRTKTQSQVSDGRCDGDC